MHFLVCSTLKSLSSLLEMMYDMKGGDMTWKVISFLPTGRSTQEMSLGLKCNRYPLVEQFTFNVCFSHSTGMALGMAISVSPQLKSRLKYTEKEWIERTVSCLWWFVWLVQKKMVIVISCYSEDTRQWRRKCVASLRTPFRPILTPICLLNMYTNPSFFHSLN